MYDWCRIAISCLHLAPNESDYRIRAGSLAIASRHLQVTVTCGEARVKDFLIVIKEGDRSDIVHFLYIFSGC